MGESMWALHVSNLICIGVDRKENGEYSGRIWHPYEDDPVVWCGTIQLIQEMEQLYDEWKFPQSSTSCHSFKTKKNAGGRQQRGGDHLAMDIQRVQNKKGDLGTFLVRVKYRQNASWQGEVVWAEGNQRRSFRSALELIKMMDSVLEQGETE